MKRIFISLLLLVGFALSALATFAGPADRPNILWITCEDMSPSLGCYGDAYAQTPNLDAFAKQSIRYTHAFATAPACSPSRSTLITGVYATSLNTMHLRSTFPIPAEFEPFPAYLRRVGYYCSNNTKTDYNTANEGNLIKAAWHESSKKAHWRNRAADQPFFSVFNFTETHQSRTSTVPGPGVDKALAAELSPSERHDPARAVVPPFYPDTPLVRQTLARYYDCITAMDKQVGRILKQLDEDGLSQNTIVFFFSDHGMGMPRGKRTLYDTGMRVPLLVRFPEKYKHLAPKPAGQTETRMVSFIDFAPTVLSLGGVPKPKHMQGNAFLGRDTGKSRAITFGARDRVDEAFDVARSARDERYLYIRNYMPHLSWNQPEGSSDRSGMRREITQLARDGKLNAAQLTYAGPTRPFEELYDTETDPHQIRNLATLPEYRARLLKMRERTKDWMSESRDLGLLPEEEVWARLRGDTPFEMAQDRRRYPFSSILETAELVGKPGQVRKLATGLKDKDSGVRYWAAVGLRAAGGEAEQARNALTNALNDQSPAVRIEAAAALVDLGEATSAMPVLLKELKHPENAVVLHAVRALQLLGKKATDALPAMKQALAQCKNPEYRLFLSFSVNALAAQATE